jgi:hypothetical protein
MRDSSRANASTTQEYPTTHSTHQAKKTRQHRRSQKSSEHHSGEHSNRSSRSANTDVQQGISPGVKVSPMRESLSKLNFVPSVYGMDQSGAENSFVSQPPITTADVAETFRAQVLAACQGVTTISPSVTTNLVPETKPQTLTPLIEAFSLERFQMPEYPSRPPIPSETAVNLNGDIAGAFRAQVLAACAEKEAYSSTNMDDLVSAVSSDPVTGAVTANESPNIVPSVSKTPTMDPAVMENLVPQDAPIDLSFGDPTPALDCPPPAAEEVSSEPISSTGPRMSSAKLLPVITPPSPKSPQTEEEFEVLADDEQSEPCQPPVVDLIPTPATETVTDKENEPKNVSRPISPDTPKISSPPPNMVVVLEEEETTSFPVVETTTSAGPDYPTDGTLCPRNSVVDYQPPFESPRKAIYESLLTSPKKIFGGGQIVMHMIGEILSPRSPTSPRDDLFPAALLTGGAKTRETATEDDLVTSFVSEDATNLVVSPPKIFSSDPITERVFDELIDTIMHEEEQARMVTSPPVLPKGDEENPVGIIVKLAPETAVETAPTTSFYVDLVKDTQLVEPVVGEDESSIPVSPVESLKVNTVPVNWLPTAGPAIRGTEEPVIFPPLQPVEPITPPPKQKKKCFCF